MPCAHDGPRPTNREMPSQTSSNQAKIRVTPCRHSPHLDPDVEVLDAATSEVAETETSLSWRAVGDKEMLCNGL
ncbi:hypothetical protein [Cutibacterium acnes]|nr:hypothetical protein [Cutibacterium acnes]MCQ8206378.1 hypothetical protein [Cutibacterium acnes subsp. acnes]TLG08266.1 hypothetical protein FD519_02100 [Cutibacterium acnes]